MKNRQKGILPLIKRRRKKRQSTYKNNISDLEPPVDENALLSNDLNDNENA